MKRDAPEQWILLGRVLGAHGIRGALSIKLDNPDSQSLKPGIRVQLTRPHLPPQILEVEKLQAGRILYVVGMHDRNTAETYRQAQILIRRADLPELESDEHYLNDLLGAAIVDADGKVLGTIASFADNNAQILIEMRTVDGHFALIPFVEPLVLEVNEAEKRIVVELPEGLLDIERKDV